MSRKQQSGYTLVELLIVVFFLVTLTLAGSALYVIFHFISKFW
jgi:Tfp pilus assembly protein PilE